jgi:hypothetical protein
MSTNIRKIDQIVGPGDPDKWPYPTITIESEISGELRDRIIARTGLTGRVTLLESEISGGYSEYTQETDYEIEVLIDGHHVWNDDYQWSTESAFGAFMTWVAGDDN